MKDLVYYKQMDQSLEDKLFFTHHLPYLEDDKITFIDYGCAQATVLKTLADKYKNSTFIGYDIDSDMQKFSTNKVTIVDSLNAIDFTQYKHKVLILSSVLHEIYSQGDKAINFLQRALNLINPTYVIIRDFYLSDYNYPYTKEESSFIQALYINKDLLTRFVNYTRAVNCFYKTKHTPSEFYTEFLLKYYYKDNFNEELEKRYFSAFGFISALINSDVLYVKYKNFYTPKNTIAGIKKDFAIDLPVKTHVQLILYNPVYDGQLF